MSEDQPVIPRIILARSTVVVCAHCRAWYGRLPAFMGDCLDKGDYCERCGCTSFTVRPGRPYGPRSRDWGDIVERWKELYPIISQDEFLKELLETVDISKTKTEKE
jgi:hypothetical protein